APPANSGTNCRSSRWQAGSQSSRNARNVATGTSRYSPDTLCRSPMLTAMTPPRLCISVVFVVELPIQWRGVSLVAQVSKPVEVTQVWRPVQQNRKPIHSRRTVHFEDDPFAFASSSHSRVRSATVSHRTDV